MGTCRAVLATGRELEMAAGPGQLEEDAVVAVVVSEAPDLGKPDAVAVEGDERIQASRMPG
jgi:hypothetical protein